MRKCQSARRWLLCVLAARLGAAEVELSLLDAVERALRTEGNLQLQLSREQLQRAGSLARQARAALLPHAAAGTSYDSRTVNLRAFGVRFEIPGAPFAVPSFVGPFSVFDARVRASQQLFDLSAIERYRASTGQSRRAFRWFVPGRGSGSTKSWKAGTILSPEWSSTLSRS